MLEGVRKRLFGVQKKSQPKHLDKEPKSPDMKKREGLSSNYDSKLFSEVVSKIKALVKITSEWLSPVKTGYPVQVFRFIWFLGELEILRDLIL